MNDKYHGDEPELDAEQAQLQERIAEMQADDDFYN